jgi:hypothetical protein
MAASDHAQEREAIVTPPFQAIRGNARIELSDLLTFMLVWYLKRLGIMLLLMSAFIGFLFWWMFRDLAVSPSDLPAGFIPNVLRETAMSTGGLVAVGLIVFVLMRVVVLPWFVLWRMGSERRTFTWVIDETGIRRTDALGAESLLPWSNILKVRCERKAFWLKVKPRGWRYLLRRAFTTEDQERLRALAARMVPG